MGQIEVNATVEHRQKAIGQFRLQLNEVFEPFMCYGLQEYVPEAAEAILRMALQVHSRLVGEDTPILANLKREKPTA